MQTQLVGLMNFDNVLFSLYLYQTQDGFEDLKIFEVMTSLPPHKEKDRMYLYLCFAFFVFVSEAFLYLYHTQDVCVN